MNTKKILLFIGCIIIRSLFVYLGYNSITLPYFRFLTIFISFGFMYQFLFKQRKSGIFVQVVWWHNLRFWHALNYFLAAYWVYVLQNNNASSILLFDITIGIYFFIRQHYKFDF